MTFVYTDGILNSASFSLIKWDMACNFKMQGNNFNRLYSEKAELEKEIWGVNESSFAPNYLPICYVNRTLVKFKKKKCQEQTNYFSIGSATGLNDKFPKRTRRRICCE